MDLKSDKKIIEAKGLENPDRGLRDIHREITRSKLLNLAREHNKMKGSLVKIIPRDESSSSVTSSAKCQFEKKLKKEEEKISDALEKKISTLKKDSQGMHLNLLIYLISQKKMMS